MKKLIAKFFIAVVVLSGIPSFSYAKTNPAAESSATESSVYYDEYRLPAFTTHTHRIYLNRGYYRISISGDGDTDLDLYVYDGNGLVVRAESYGDDEAVNLTVYNGGYVFVKVVNRGKVYNDYAFSVQ